MIEFAFIFPIVLMITFGIMEVSLCMASLVTLEGGLKEASRYGITAQPQQRADRRPEEAGPGPPSRKTPRIRAWMTIGLYPEPEHARPDQSQRRRRRRLRSSTASARIKDGEPYTDLPNIPKAGDKPNGHV